MIYKSGVYQLDIEVERTRQFYKDEHYESCTCAGCRNFAIAHHLLPEAVQRLFEQFGMDPGKPAEMTAYNSNDGVMTFYEGFYHLCGTILSGKNPWLQVGEKAYQLNEQYALNVAEDVSVFFTESCALVEKGFPTPVIQMEIQCNVPWVLDEPNPYFYSKG